MHLQIKLNVIKPYTWTPPPPLTLAIFLFSLVRKCFGEDRREVGRDVFRVAINKSVPAHALWSPEPLYPFHVFPMSQGPDL